MPTLVSIDKICAECGTRSMSAALAPDHRTKLYYECKNCGSFIKDPKKYDKIYEENKDEIIAKFHEKFTKGKTEDEKKELLDDILQSTTGGSTGGGSNTYTGALILEPEVVPFYEEISEYHTYTNMYGGKDSEYRKKPYWVKPAKPPLMSEDKFESTKKVVKKYSSNKKLSRHQKKIRKKLKEKKDEKINSVLEDLYEEFFDEELKVYGKKIDKSYVGDPVIPTGNISYQVIFSYPDLEIMKIGKCF